MSDDYKETDVAVAGAEHRERGTEVAYLVVVRGNNVGETYPVVGPSMVIGRGSGTDLHLTDDGVSRFHCKLHEKPEGVYVEDLGSRNGTYCNGERVAMGLRLLNEGDRVQIGTTFVLRFTYAEKSEAKALPDVVTDTHDAVTRVLSRRFFLERLEADFAAIQGRRSPLSLMLVHVDRFAEIAGDYGQPVLDAGMAAVADQLRAGARAEDVIGRIGPGDLALASIRSSPGDTFMFAERTRKAFPGRTSPPITLSIGIASVAELDVESAHDLLTAASSALYRARNHGGNRAVVCTPDLVRDG